MEAALHDERPQAQQTDRRVQPERRAVEAGREAGQAAKEHARAVWSDAKDTARSHLNEKQQEAARGIGDFASALRQAADQVDGGRQATVGRLAQSTADGLERISEHLRNKDAGT